MQLLSVEQFTTLDLNNITTVARFEPHTTLDPRDRRGLDREASGALVRRRHLLEAGGEEVLHGDVKVRPRPRHGVSVVGVNLKEEAVGRSMQTLGGLQI